MAGGGSFTVEDGILVGSLAQAGVGMRLSPKLDVRAQTLGLIVPSTDAREDMKIVLTLTLTAGLTL